MGHPDWSLGVLYSIWEIGYYQLMGVANPEEFTAAEV
jgi:hypothetical protein